MEHVHRMDMYDIDARDPLFQSAGHRERGIPELRDMYRKIPDLHPVPADGVADGHIQRPSPILVRGDDANFVPKLRLCTSHFEASLRRTTIPGSNGPYDVQNLQRRIPGSVISRIRHRGNSPNVLFPRL